VPVAMSSVISKMIHENERRNRLQAMGASLFVHAAVFGALFYGLEAAPPVIALERQTFSVSLADFPSAPRKTALRTVSEKTAEPVKESVPAPKASPKPDVKPVEKSVPKEKPVQKQMTAEPKAIEKPEPVEHTDPVAAHQPISEVLPEKTPEIKAQPTEAAPLSEAFASPPSHTVASAAPVDSPPTPDTIKKADPNGPGATVLGQIRAMIENAIAYPAIARRLRLEGVVTLSFMLTPDGAVAKAEVLQSSGSSVLDRKALNTLWDLSGDFPSLEAITQLTIPITFSLKKS
jgi:protein TonB